MAAAALVAGISLALIRRLGLQDADGQPLGLAPKTVGSGARYVIGGAILSALAGTWTYGYLRPRLPH